jgi:hypothetical protein
MSFSDGKTPVPPSIDPFFFSTEFIAPTPTIPAQNIASVIIILFGIIADGGGAYIDGQGHIVIVPPGDPGPAWGYLVNLAEYRLAQSIPGKEGLEMQRQALQNIVGMAIEVIAQISGELRNG